MRSKFNCPHGVTNVWDRPPVNGNERLKAPKSAKAAHLNQKPLDLMRMTIEAASDPGDVVWEPFGGLFSATYAACETGRRGFGAEIDPTYYQLGVQRFIRGCPGHPGPLFQGDPSVHRAHHQAARETEVSPNPQLYAHARRLQARAT